MLSPGSFSCPSVGPSVRNSARVGDLPFLHFRCDALVGLDPTYSTILTHSCTILMHSDTIPKHSCTVLTHSSRILTHSCRNYIVCSDNSFNLQYSNSFNDSYFDVPNLAGPHYPLMSQMRGKYIFTHGTILCNTNASVKHIYPSGLTAQADSGFRECLSECNQLCGAGDLPLFSFRCDALVGDDTY